MEDIRGLTAMVHPHRGRIYGQNLNNKLLCVSTKVKGEPIAYYAAIMLHDVTFVVHRYGWERMQANRGVRNVHAWAKGTVIDWSYMRHVRPIRPSDWHSAFYNYRLGHFADVMTPDIPLLSAKYVLQSGRYCHYQPSE